MEPDPGIYCLTFHVTLVPTRPAREEDEASLKLELGTLEQYDDYPAIFPPAVMWCINKHFTSAAAYTYYGNEAANIGVCYQAAVLLVDVPP